MDDLFALETSSNLEDLLSKKQALGFEPYKIVNDKLNKIEK